MFLNYDSFYGEELLAPRPNPKLEDHHLQAVHGYLFNIFATTIHIGGRSSTRNLRTRHSVVTWTHFGRIILRWIFKKLRVGAWTGSIWLKRGTVGGYL